jgi:hypothetical protein
VAVYKLLTYSAEPDGTLTIGWTGRQKGICFMKQISISDHIKISIFIKGMKDRGYDLDRTLEYLEGRKGILSPTDTDRVIKSIRENW